MSGSNATLQGSGRADIQALVAGLVDRITSQSATGAPQGGAGAPSTTPIITSVTIRG